jgi:hypothetical protein
VQIKIGEYLPPLSPEYFFRLLPKNTKVTYLKKSLILPVDLYGCGNWQLTLKEKQGAEDVREQGADGNIGP